MEIGNRLFGNSRGDYAVNRALEGRFVAALHDAGFDSDGFCRTWTSETTVPSPYNADATATPHYVVQPYVLDDRDPATICPNFFDRITGLKLRWYKHPLRDSYANYDLGEDMLASVLERFVAECRDLGATPHREM